MNIGLIVKHRRAFKALPIDTVLRVRFFKIQKRRKRGKRGGYEQRRRKMIDEYEKNRGIHHHNLTSVNIIKDRHLKSKSCNLTMGLVNVRSVKNKDIWLKQVMTEENIDICVMTETWLTKSDETWIKSTELNKDGFSMKNSFRNDGRKGGGLALVYRDMYKIQLVEEKYARTYHSVKWKLTMKNTHLHILGIYRPPPSTVHTTTISQFTDEFLENLQDDIISSTNLIILGDFNIHIDDDNDADAQTFKDCTTAIGLEQHIGSYTHNQGHTLDHIYTLVGGEPQVHNCQTQSFISDHCLVTADINIQRGDIERCTITSRNYKDFQLSQFRNDLKFKWSENSTLDELVQEYKSTAESCMNKHAPKVTKRVTKRKSELWYNEQIREQKRTVRRRERVWRRYAEDHQWKAYTIERNRLNRMIFANKKVTLCEKTEQCGKDSKKLYALMNNMCGTVKTNPLPEAINDQALADSFADYFLQKIVDIREHLKDYAKYCPSGECDGNLSHFKPVSEEDVRKIIASVASKSCELDEIPTKYLKQSLEECIGIITEIINASMKQGLFVSSWKTAVVRPLLKKSGLDLVNSNYRPVSNLSFLSKVLEKAVLSQFNEHCALYHLFPDYQSAYRQNYSCETALLKIVDDILWNMEHQKITALACIDLSAAFDTVDHAILADVLQAKFGVTDRALDWFTTYLQPREFMVNVGESYSSRKQITFSVPQGSCAGPTLYSVYASTMAEVVPQNLDIHGYADDHAIKTAYNGGTQSSELAALGDIELALTKIRDWMNENRLKMNDSKTEFIVFGSRHQLNKALITSLNVNSELVNASDSVKYLGAHLDRNLNLKHHVAMKCRVASQNLFRLKNIRKYLTQEACNTFVLGLVVVHLDYANGLFIGLPAVVIKRLQRIQNMAAKLVLGKGKCDSATQCLKDLHWLPVRLRVEYKIAVTVFKCLHGQAPNYLSDMLQRPTRRSNTRAAADQYLLAVPTTKRKTFADRSFSVAGPKLWNTLPENLRSLPTLDTFKKNLKTYLFSKF